MNNLKKYVPKRTYKERGQLQSRKKLGFLEKKKDYKVRANDFQKKQKKYKTLVEQTRTKNPDEFYFQMDNSKIIDGENYTINKEDDRKQVIQKRINNHQKILNLVNHKRSVVDKLSKKLEVEMQGISNTLKLEDNEEEDIDDEEDNEDINNNSKKPFSHKLFFDDMEEIENFEAEKHFNTSSNMIGNTHNRIKNTQLNQFNYNQLNLKEEDIKEEAVQKKRDIKKLIQNREKLSTLSKISNTLEYQKHMIVPGKKRKVEGNNGLHNFKFFNERKK